MEMNFCRRCGASLQHVNNHVYKCTNDHILFANSSPATAIWLVNSKNEVLIVERAIKPGKGLLDAPGGFLDGDIETFEQAIEREVAEEIGINKNQYTDLTYLLSGVDQYEYGGEAIPVLTCMYWARIEDDVTLNPMDDVASASFMSFEDIDLNKVYFPSAVRGLKMLKELL
ncbi:MAG: NUDIX domain-containing protein [Candidatus Nomurabacteria bacterium]|nr:MAG: NUDIX domain-containing protein [Candidatus Nomurabacteria bacterium]